MSEGSTITALGAATTGPQVGYNRSAFIGSCKHHVWQAIRASSAAPYYLDDFSDGTLLPGFKLAILLCFTLIVRCLHFLLCPCNISAFTFLARRHTPLARWCYCSKQSYHICHSRSTTFMAGYKNWLFSFHWMLFSSNKGNRTQQTLFALEIFIDSDFYVCGCYTKVSKKTTEVVEMLWEQCIYLNLVHLSGHFFIVFLIHQKII